MEHRIFIGIPIRHELSKTVSVWLQSNINEKGIRAIAEKDLHLTLVPPWYEKDPAKAANLLEIFKNSDEIFIRFNKINYGPNLKHPRLIWVLGPPSRELSNLSDKAKRIFATQGQNEERPLLPHLTIARFKQKDFYSFGKKAIEANIDWHTSVNHICLYESHLSSNGAGYDILSKVKLKQNGQSY